MIMGEHIGANCFTDGNTRCCLLYCAGKNCGCDDWDKGLNENIVFLVFKNEIGEIKKCLLRKV